MEKFKSIGKKVLGTFFALMLVSSLVLSSSASAASTTTKAMKINGKKGTAQIVRDTRTVTWSTSFSSAEVTSTVSGTYQYLRTESGSFSNGSVSSKKATATVSITKNLSSGFVFTIAKGTHKAASGSVTPVTVNTSV